MRMLSFAALCVAVSGRWELVAAFELLVRPFGVVEMARPG